MEYYNYFSDGFEDGTLNNWTFVKFGLIPNNSTASISSTVYKNGAYSAKIYQSTGIGHYGRLEHNIRNIPNANLYRITGWYRTDAASSSGKSGGIYIMDANNVEIISMHHIDAPGWYLGIGADLVRYALLANHWYYLKLIWDKQNNLGDYYVYDSDGTTLLASNLGVTLINGTLSAETIELVAWGYFGGRRSHYFDDVEIEYWGASPTVNSGISFDYLTVSKSNNIGLNGIGDRTTTWSDTIITW